MARLYRDPEIGALVKQTMADVRKRRAKNKLRDLRVNRVDVVDKGSNPEARIMFYKQDSSGKEMNDLDKAYAIANKMVEAGEANSVPEALLRMSYMSQYKSLLRAAMKQMPTPPAAPPVAKVQRNPELVHLEKTAQELVDAGEAQDLATGLAAVCQADPDAYRAYTASVVGGRD